MTPCIALKTTKFNNPSITIMLMMIYPSKVSQEIQIPYPTKAPLLTSPIADLSLTSIQTLTKIKQRKVSKSA